LIVTHTKAAESRRPRRNFAGAERKMLDGARDLGTWTYGPATPDLPAELPNVPTHAQIKRLEQAIADHLPPVEMAVVHHFAPGLYGRELHIPAGTVLTGKIHKEGHLSLLLAGEITVWTEQGMKRLQAPQVLNTTPGTKRVGYAHTDTVWVCVHANPTDETDLVALEADLIEPEAPVLPSPVKELPR
jgi:quercetin dioxygenase-like cupin family protein